METGEIVGNICEGDHIVHGTTIEQTLAYCNNFGKGMHHLKVFDNIIDKLDLTGAEAVMMFKLMRFISYEDNLLRYNNKLLDVRAIAKLVGQEPEATRKTITKLVRRGVLGVVYTGALSTSEECSLRAYIFNPFICVKGKRLHLNVIRIFQNAGWDFNQVGVRIEDGEEIYR